MPAVFGFGLGASLFALLSRDTFAIEPVLLLPLDCRLFPGPVQGLLRRGGQAAPCSPRGFSGCTLRISGHHRAPGVADSGVGVCLTKKPPTMSEQEVVELSVSGLGAEDHTTDASERTLRTPIQNRPS